MGSGDGFGAAGGDSVEVISEETGEEAVEFGEDGGRGWDLRGEGEGQLLEGIEGGAGEATEVGLVWGWGETEFGEEFGFESEDEERGGGWGGEEGDEVVEEGIEAGERGIGFADLLDEDRGVGGATEVGVVGSEAGVGVLNGGFAEDVEVGTAAADEGELSFVEEVEASAEGGFGAARAFGDGGEASEVRGEPVDDEACFGQRPGAEDQAGGGFEGHGVCGLRVPGTGPGVDHGETMAQRRGEAKRCVVVQARRG
jgi:hypothetical protein